jgi:LysM repeat protein
MARALTEIPDMEPRNITARVLAPLALIACVAALFLLVSGTLSDDGGGGGGGDRNATRSEQARDKPKVKGDSYVVVSGDTFSGIAVKTGIPLAQLERLNPDLDTGTLNAGQQIKLR